VQVLETIRGEFPELKIVMADQLMFVKEDLIIPQHNTFYVSEQLCLFCMYEKREKNILLIFVFFFFLCTLFNTFICRPSDSTVSEDAGIEHRAVATLALTARRSYHSAGSHTHENCGL
jgi:hypothetical protein